MNFKYSCFLFSKVSHLLKYLLDILKHCVYLLIWVLFGKTDTLWYQKTKLRYCPILINWNAQWKYKYLNKNKIYLSSEKDVTLVRAEVTSSYLSFMEFTAAKVFSVGWFFTQNGIFQTQIWFIFRTWVCIETGQFE